MYKYDVPEIKEGDTNESYLFIKTPDELITVQFTAWDGSTIKKVKFTVHQSNTHRKLVAIGKCVSPIENQQELSLHTLRVSQNAPFENRTKEFNVEYGIDLKSGDFLNFRHIRYDFGQSYDSKWSCEDFTGPSIPDTVPGGVVKKPSI